MRSVVEILLVITLGITILGLVFLYTHTRRQQRMGSGMVGPPRPQPDDPPPDGTRILGYRRDHKLNGCPVESIAVTDYRDTSGGVWGDCWQCGMVIRLAFSDDKRTINQILRGKVQTPDMLRVANQSVPAPQ